MTDTVSIETIRTDSSEQTFPCDILAGCNSAAVFFCAAFYGRQDVIHMLNHGVSELWLNDMDVEKLNKMAALYGAANRLLPGDAYAVARELASAGRKFDVVNCDPFTNQMMNVLVDEYAVFSALADKWFITGATGLLFAEMGVEATAEALTKWMQSKGHADAYVERLVQRNSSYQDGVYWVVFKRPGSKPAAKANADTIKAGKKSPDRRAKAKASRK